MGVVGPFQTRRHVKQMIDRYPSTGVVRPRPDGYQRRLIKPQPPSIDQNSGQRPHDGLRHRIASKRHVLVETRSIAFRDRSAVFQHEDGASPLRRGRVRFGEGPIQSGVEAAGVHAWRVRPRPPFEEIVRKRAFGAQRRRRGRNLGVEIGQGAAQPGAVDRFLRSKAEQTRPHFTGPAVDPRVDQLQ